MKTGICGIGGRMGEAVLRISMERGHTLAAGFDWTGSKFFGLDAGAVLHSDDLGVKIGSIDDEGVKNCSVIIDFSSPAATMELVKNAIRHKTALVIGTTGLSEEIRSQIESAAREIPVVFSPNMSVGVNILFKLTEIASKALDSSFDVEIFEAHHRFKKDAPSGTANKLLEVVKKNFNGLENAKEVYGREGITGERSKNEIGMMVMRGGDIVGEHTVFFTAMGERIELTHRATNRDVLARGAVVAAEFVASKGPGLYNMFDVLGL